MRAYLITVAYWTVWTGLMLMYLIGCLKPEDFR